MAHAIIEHAARELPDRGYRVEIVRATADQPAQLLVQLAPHPDDGGERWALLTVFEDLGASLPDAHLAQIFLGLRATAGPNNRRGDLARLIVAVNNRIALGQFCFREADSL